jgi:hypothetical protein
MFSFSKGKMRHRHFSFKDGSTRLEWGISPEGAEEEYCIEGMAFRVMGEKFSFFGNAHLKCLKETFGLLRQMDDKDELPNDVIVEKDGQKFWRGQKILSEEEAGKALAPYPPEPDDEKKEEKK